MPTATATSEITPVFDFDQAVVALRKDSGASLTDVLAELAKLPAADPQDRPKPSTAVELVTDGLMKSIKAIPDVFGKIKPGGRRALAAAELASLQAEKDEIDTAIKALTKRKDEIHAMVSVHFDVLAEKQKRVDEGTPQDKKGHYLIARPGDPETAPVKGSGRYFTRERSSDKAALSHERLLALYEEGKITRAEYLAFTATQRDIDQEKVRRQLLSRTRRQRTQEILDEITVVTPGRLSINLRGK
ncbi:hypothetical protein [Streptomyces griseoaurantiacus]|uniref:hypothetical protein n=1 Tax=Streptomyces griseoaurantiacus TaxID=68213 RepID=UPI0036A86C79